MVLGRYLMNGYLRSGSKWEHAVPAKGLSDGAPPYALHDLAEAGVKGGDLRAPKDQIRP